MSQGVGAGALKTAQEASEFGVKEHVPDFSPEATLPLSEIVDDIEPPVAIATLIEHLIDAEKQLLEAHPAIVGVPYNGPSPAGLRVSDSISTVKGRSDEKPDLPVQSISTARPNRTGSDPAVPVPFGLARD